MSCEMEDLNLEKQWKGYADAINAEQTKEMKEKIKELKKLAEKKSYEYIIKKYSKLIVKNAGLEKGKFYYLMTSNIISAKRLVIYVSDDCSLGLKIFDCFYITNYKGKQYCSLHKDRNILDEEEELFIIIDLYREFTGDKIRKTEINECKPEYNEDDFMFINDKRALKIDADYYLYNYLLLDVYVDKRENDIDLVLYFHDCDNGHRNKMFFVEKGELKSVSDEQKNNVFECMNNGDFCNFISNFKLRDYLRHIRSNEECDMHTMIYVNILKSIGIEFKRVENINFDCLIDKNPF